MAYTSSRPEAHRATLTKPGPNFCLKTGCIWCDIIAVGVYKSNQPPWSDASGLGGGGLRRHPDYRSEAHVMSSDWTGR